jgi:hypothetical protein
MLVLHKIFDINATWKALIIYYTYFYIYWLIKRFYKYWLIKRFFKYWLIKRYKYIYNRIFQEISWFVINLEIKNYKTEILWENKNIWRLKRIKKA